MVINFKWKIVFEYFFFGKRLFLYEFNIWFLILDVDYDVSLVIDILVSKLYVK